MIHPSVAMVIPVPLQIHHSTVDFTNDEIQLSHHSALDFTNDEIQCRMMNQNLCCRYL